MESKPLIIGFFGGPGIGKSVLAAETFVELKKQGKSVELVTEVAKEFTWQGRFKCLSNQFVVSANQHNREYSLYGHVDIIVTDGPILLGLAYNKNSLHFENFILEEFKSQNNLNFLLKRKHKYQTFGRKESEIEAIKIDGKIKDLLDKHGIDYHEIVADESAAEKILELIK